jgi:hypothetical protein
MQSSNQKQTTNQRQASFLAEKVKRMQAGGGDAQEMMATIRDYLHNERQVRVTEVYEHTAHTAKVIPIARLKAV